MKEVELFAGSSELVVALVVHLVVGELGVVAGKLVVWLVNFTRW